MLLDALRTVVDPLKCLMVSKIPCSLCQAALQISSLHHLTVTYKVLNFINPQNKNVCHLYRQVSRRAYKTFSRSGQKMSNLLRVLCNFPLYVIWDVLPRFFGLRLIQIGPFCFSSTFLSCVLPRCHWTTLSRIIQVSITCHERRLSLFLSII